MANQALPGGKEGKELQQMLLPGEHVIQWMQGRGGALLVATDQRALIIKVGGMATGQMMGTKILTAWPYQHIISVDLQTIFGWPTQGWVEIITAGTQAQRGNRAISKSIASVSAENMVGFFGKEKEWRAFVNVLRERIQAVQTTQTTPNGSMAAATGAPSIPDQIAALAKLRDAGALTNAEFETKKAELLARM